MLWKRRTAASKQDHRVVVEHVLRPGAVLGVSAGAGNDGESAAAGGGSGMHGARARGQQGRGTRPVVGRGRHVGVIPVGGGAAAAAERRPRVTHCTGGRRTEQGSTCPRKKKRGDGSGGPIWKSQKSQGPLGKERFPTDLEIQ
jgi:hypothetical protein